MTTLYMHNVEGLATLHSRVARCFTEKVSAWIVSEPPTTLRPVQPPTDTAILLANPLCAHRYFMEERLLKAYQELGREWRIPALAELSDSSEFPLLLAWILLIHNDQLSIHMYDKVSTNPFHNIDDKEILAATQNEKFKALNEERQQLLTTLRKRSYYWSRKLFPTAFLDRQSYTLRMLMLAGVEVPDELMDEMPYDQPSVLRTSLPGIQRTDRRFFQGAENKSEQRSLHFLFLAYYFYGPFKDNIKDCIAQALCNVSLQRQRTLFTEATEARHHLLTLFLVEIGCAQGVTTTKDPVITGLIQSRL